MSSLPPPPAEGPTPKETPSGVKRGIGVLVIVVGALLVQLFLPLAQPISPRLLLQGRLGDVLEFPNTTRAAEIGAFLPKLVPDGATMVDGPDLREYRCKSRTPAQWTMLLRVDDDMDGAELAMRRTVGRANWHDILGHAVISPERTSIQYRWRTGSGYTLTVLLAPDDPATNGGGDATRVRVTIDGTIEGVCGAG